MGFAPNCVSCWISTRPSIPVAALTGRTWPPIDGVNVNNSICPQFPFREGGFRGQRRRRRRREGGREGGSVRVWLASRWRESSASGNWPLWRDGCTSSLISPNTPRGGGGKNTAGLPDQSSGKQNDIFIYIQLQFGLVLVFHRRLLRRFDLTAIFGRHLIELISIVLNYRRHEALRGMLPMIPRQLEANLNRVLIIFLGFFGLIPDVRASGNWYPAFQFPVSVSN